MKISIKLAKKEDIQAYTDLLQRAYQDAYTDPSIGLTKDCFSKENFATEHTQDYLKNNLAQRDKQKTWLALNKNTLVGSITIIDRGNDCEIKGFYVDPEYQGKGIGKQLFPLALDFANGRDIVLDTYSHNRKTIEMYQRWGFKKDEQRGRFFRHWPEWPEGLQAECLYMRFRQNK